MKDALRQNNERVFVVLFSDCAPVFRTARFLIYDVVYFTLDGNSFFKVKNLFKINKICLLPQHEFIRQ